jgi:integral membrane protein (TIGR00529 family)
VPVELLPLAVILALIIMALRFKAPVGITLFAAGILLSLWYRVPFANLTSGYWDLAKSERFLSLTGVMILITTLGTLLKELGYLERLSKACRRLWGGNRTAVAMLPFLVGLMPMPGGALLSAPLVDEVLAAPKYSPEFKTVTNYWFRHLVEFFWPIYPGVILTQGITGMPMFKVSLLQIPMTVIMAILGGYFFSRKIDRSGDLENQTAKSIWHIIASLWPILIAIVVHVAFGVDMVWGVLAGVIALVIVSRPSRAIQWEAVKKGLSYRMVLLVFGILSFQTVLELTGAINSLPRIAAVYDFPPELLIFLVCFTVGLLTGMVAAFVGMGYVLLARFLYSPEIIPGNILLAFLSGYLGMLLSPTHLCLILTNSYFKSDLAKVYRLMAIPLILLAILGFLVCKSGWGRLFM